MCVCACVFAVCLLDQASCGCCLMQEQAQRMEWLFNVTYGEMNKEMTQAKTILNNMRGERHVHESHKRGDSAEHHQSVLN